MCLFVEDFYLQGYGMELQIVMKVCMSVVGCSEGEVI